MVSRNKSIKFALSVAVAAVLMTGCEQDGAYINAGGPDGSQVIQDYARSNSNDKPTVADYEAAGVTGVNTSNLDAMNAAVDLKDAEDVDTKEELQAIIDGVLKNVAIDKIKAYADDSSKPAPTVADYEAAGVTGVTDGNIADVNSAVDSKEGSDVADTADIQKVVDVVNAGALGVIIDYANDKSNPVPTANTYQEAGVSGVTDANLADINAIIDAKEGADVDSKDKVQALVDAYLKEKALEKIAAYAEDGTNPAPSVEDYANADIEGVNADNLNEVNAAVDAKEGADVDTHDELQAVVTDALGIKAAIDKIKEYAKTNGASEAPTADDYALLGVDKPSDEDLAKINDAIKAKEEADVDTQDEIVAVAELAVAKAPDYAIASYLEGAASFPEARDANLTLRVTEEIGGVNSGDVVYWMSKSDVYTISLQKDVAEAKFDTATETMSTADWEMDDSDALMYRIKYVGNSGKFPKDSRLFFLLKLSVTPPDGGSGSTKLIPKLESGTGDENTNNDSTIIEFSYGE